MKKTTIIGMVALVAVVLGGGGFWYSQKQAQQAQQKIVDKYIQAIEKQQPKKITGLISADKSISRKAIQKKYQIVFDSLDISKIKASRVSWQKENGKVRYRLTYTSSLGTFHQDFATKVTKKDGTYKIAWKPNLIFTQLSSLDDKIYYQNTVPVRGKIVDTTGKALAENGTFPLVGVVPSKIATNRTENIKKIAKALELSESDVTSALAQSWVTDDTFVPLKTYIDESPSFADDVASLVSTQETTKRYYPYAEAAAHLIGYTGQVTADDLKKDPTATGLSLIGKTGLEKVYDKQLRGKMGGRIYVSPVKGEDQKTVVEENAVNGQDVKVTLNADLQKAAYSSLQGKKGATVVLSPKDGSVLVATSSPSYNPNKMANGISDSDYKALTSNSAQPFLNRFTNRYAPGSTFKTLTASIGIDAGITTPTKERTISGLKWQKDSSWGSYYVTRVSDPGTAVSMNTALIYSDNIYFAQETLDIGATKYVAGLQKFSFGKDLGFPLDMAKSQISNSGKLASDILLADTGYGQGQLLISPLEQASMYSTLVTGGTQMYPKLQASTTTKAVKEVISSKASSEVTDSLQQVVSNESGTAHKLNDLGLTIAAKTGTAEIKEKQDTKGTENSFLMAYNPTKKNYILVSLVEDYSDGQSATVLNHDLLPSLDAIQ